MQTITKFTGFICVVAMVGIVSCSDETPKTELSAGAKQYLAMRMGSNNAMTQNMSGPINQSFQGLFSRSGGFNGKISGDSSEIPPDTTVMENPWQSCAIITETDNEDGSHTSIYDYGDGCEEGWEGYMSFMHGKMTSTYRELFSQTGSVIRNSYYYSSAYDNYGGNYNGQWSWLMNGGGVYEGESEYDTASQKFSGAYSYLDETTYQYDSVTYFYKSNGSTRYTETKYVVESNENEYTFGGDYYKSKVLKPLVSDFSCYQQNSSDASFCFFWIYVSGRERIEYKNGDEEGVFEIDYGNGACDNIVTIYEDGTATVIDLSKSWY
jgi:hypothetical protein